MLAIVGQQLPTLIEFRQNVGETLADVLSKFASIWRFLSSIYCYFNFFVVYKTLLHVIYYKSIYSQNVILVGFVTHCFEFWYVLIRFDIWIKKCFLTAWSPWTGSVGFVGGAAAGRRLDRNSGRRGAGVHGAGGGRGCSEAELAARLAGPRAGSGLQFFTQNAKLLIFINLCQLT